MKYTIEIQIDASYNTDLPAIVDKLRDKIPFLLENEYTQVDYIRATPQRENVEVLVHDAESEARALRLTKQSRVSDRDKEWFQEVELGLQRGHLVSLLDARRIFDEACAECDRLRKDRNRWKAHHNEQKRRKQRAQRATREARDELLHVSGEARLMRAILEKEHQHEALRARVAELEEVARLGKRVIGHPGYACGVCGSQGRDYAHAEAVEVAPGEWEQQQCQECDERERFDLSLRAALQPEVSESSIHEPCKSKIDKDTDE